MVDVAERVPTEEAPAGYWMTELGLLPQDWNVVRLGALAAKLKAGGTPSRRDPSYFNGDIPFVKIEDITASGGTLRRTKESISRPGIDNSSAWVVPVNSVLVTMYASIGETAVTEIPVATNQAIAAVIPRPDMADPQFLAYALKVSSKRLASYNIQTTQRNVSKGILESFPIALPPLPEQRAIAHVLSTVQRAMEATEGVIAATRELKRSLMRHLFTVGPIPVDRAGAAELKATPFGLISEGWPVLPLDSVAGVQSGLTKGRKLDGRCTVRLPYLRVANVQDGFLDLSEIKEIDVPVEEVSRFSLSSGDVLLTEGGDFDKLGRGVLWRGEVDPCLHQNHIFAVRTDRAVLLPEYFSYYVQSQLAKRYFLQVAHRTTHLASINSTKLKALPVPVPPLYEQERMIAALDGSDRKLRSERDTEQALELVFDSLLGALISGRLRVVRNAYS